MPCLERSRTPLSGLSPLCFILHPPAGILTPSCSFADPNGGRREGAPGIPRDTPSSAAALLFALHGLIFLDRSIHTKSYFLETVWGQRINRALMNTRLKTRFSYPSNVLTFITFSLPGLELRLYKIRFQWPEQSSNHKTRGTSLLVKTLQCFSLAIRPTSRPLATASMPCRHGPHPRTPCFPPRLCCRTEPRRC